MLARPGVPAKGPRQRLFHGGNCRVAPIRVGLARPLDDADEVVGQVRPQVGERHTFAALSTSATAFYGRLGWERWRGPTYVRRGDGSLERTEDEDDGIMVLRFGPSGEVDLTSPICCEDRPGDAW